jgi:hypothetical protein
MRVKRQRPSTQADRQRAAELRKIMNGSRSSKAEVTAAREEYDRLCPSILPGAPPVALLSSRARQRETPSQPPPSKQSIPSPVTATPDPLQALLDKCLSPETLESIAIEGRARSREKAENASPLERAQTLLAELPEHALNKLARAVADWLRSEDKSRPKENYDHRLFWILNGWLSRQSYNRSDVHGSTETVAAAVDDVYRLLAERDAADAGWFVRRWEKDNPAPVQPFLPKTGDQLVDLAEKYGLKK